MWILETGIPENSKPVKFSENSKRYSRIQKDQNTENSDSSGGNFQYIPQRISALRDLHFFAG
jgi:hypothetical protein